ncbi:hypothetical protein LEP1GSC068_3817 [Leptospira sp. Fiocruz LV3954]|nr:hypothetical protein LEP1GSC068_3817 [Leptospira sp. Fiocruz LV3954]EMI62458.1 hypothetical protein LEP1GSC076_3894 [Leptospira sp. Fiocruz LV4135]
MPFVFQGSNFPLSINANERKISSNTDRDEIVVKIVSDPFQLNFILRNLNRIARF